MRVLVVSEQNSDIPFDVNHITAGKGAGRLKGRSIQVDVDETRREEHAGEGRLKQM